MLNSSVLEGGRSPGPRRMTVALIVVVLLVAVVLGVVFGWQAVAGSFFKKFMAQAAANYRATVLTAFQNVADSLLALQGDAEVLAAQTGAEHSAAESLQLVQAQYKAGGANYLQVLTAEQAYQNATLALVKARAQRFLDTAALFQALGGGWWNRSDTNAPVSAAQGIS